MSCKHVCTMVVVAGLGLSAGAQAAQPRQTTTVDVFVGGVEYPNFRTPSLVTTTNGTLIALAEGRTGDEPGFGGDTDLVMKRSFDGGLTWTPLQVIENPSAFGEKMSNNTTVVDQTNGRVWVLYNRYEGNHGTVSSQPGTTNNTAWARFSDNHGATWSDAIDLTLDVKDFANWNTQSFGPGSGIQTDSGRLIIPASRWTAPFNTWNDYAVYSDDHGVTWQRGAMVSNNNFSNENSVVELANGQILMDARQNSAAFGPRLNYYSADEGSTWVGPPISGQSAVSVHAASERFTLQSAGDDANCIIWTGPGDQTDRYDLVVRTSYDEGMSFGSERMLYDGYSGYSDISILANGNAGILWETNQARSLSFTTINKDFIDPSDELIAYDDFRYQAGNILGDKNGGYGFAAGWAGNADLTGLANPIMEASDLHYTDSPFVIEGDRRPVFFNFAGGSMARQFNTPMDLGEDETYYFTLLVRQDNISTDEENATEELKVAFLDGVTEVAAFGVQGDESYFVENAGQRLATAGDQLTKGTTHYLVGKIEASSGSFDQLFFSAFQSGELVPETEAGMTWTLAGTTSMSSSSLLDRLMITAGNRATWVLDDLRVGTRFADVVSNASVTLDGDLDGDGFVGIDDLNIVLGNWNQSVPPANPLADPSGDGFVGIDDLNLVLGNWNAGTPPSDIATIPEPASGLLMAAASVVFTRQRRAIKR